MTALGRPHLDAVETRGPVLELDAAAKLIEDGRTRRSAQAHAILALDLARGMHEPVSELAIIGEQQQPRCVHVEPADDDPSTAVRGRQPLEHGRPVLGIAARGHFSHRLVINEHLGAGRAPVEIEPFPVEADGVVGRPAIAETCDLAVDRDPPGADPLLDAAARSVPRTCEKLLQSFVHLNHGT